MKLWTQIANNLEFVAVCILIVAALIIAAKLVEKKLPGMRQVSPARRISIIGIFAAIAVVLHVMDFPLLFLAPDFYKLDFSEVPVLMGGFFLGPSAAVAIEGVKVLLKLLFKGTSTAFVGDLANFVVGCSFVLPATIIYTAKKSKTSALLGLVIGTLCMTVFGTAFNAVYLLPKFAQLYGVPMEVLISMGAKVHSGVKSVVSFVVLCVAPLNLVKGTVVSVLTLLLYKRMEKPLFRISGK